MLSNIARVVEKFKQNWSGEIEDQAILDACQEVKHKHRQRELGPVVTLRLFLLQVLWGNVACNHVVRLARLGVTGNAYCAARSRLPLAVFESLLTRCTVQMAAAVRNSGRWLGHRLFLMDGSSFSMSDTPELQEHFGQSGQQALGCGFPTAHWLALVHFGSGMIQKVFTAPLRTHDLNGVTQLHPEMEAGDVAVGDRAFGSYAHLALLSLRGVFGIFRAHQKLIVDFTAGRPHVQPGDRKARRTGIPSSRWVQSVGSLDQIVEWFRPAECPSWLSAETFAALPTTLMVRELRYRIGRPGFRVKEVTLVTTLLNARRYSRDDLAAAYGFRWTIETCFGHLKTTMKMDVLRCQTVDGVLKELMMFLLVYNMVRMTMLAAAARQGVSVARISFVDALRWLASARPGDALPDLVLVPERPGRHEPRVKKRRPKEYDLMTRPRAILRKALAEEGVNA